MNPFKISEAAPSDISFIYETWLNSYRYGSFFGKSHRNSIFFSGYKQVIDSILSNEQTTVLVARSPENEDLIFSYLVFEPGTLHYAFTKSAYVDMKIASAIFVHAFGNIKAPVNYTHQTQVGRRIADEHPNLTHNAILLYKKGIQNG